VRRRLSSSFLCFVVTSVHAVAVVVLFVGSFFRVPVLIICVFAFLVVVAVFPEVVVVSLAHSL